MASCSTDHHCRGWCSDAAWGPGSPWWYQALGKRQTPHCRNHSSTDHLKIQVNVIRWMNNSHKGIDSWQHTCPFLFLPKARATARKGIWSMTVLRLTGPLWVSLGLFHTTRFTPDFFITLQGTQAQTSIKESLYFLFLPVMTAWLIVFTRQVCVCWKSHGLKATPSAYKVQTCKQTEGEKGESLPWCDATRAQPAAQKNRGFCWY